MLSYLTSGLGIYEFQAGVKVEDPEIRVFNGQEVEVWPRIVWSPRWAMTFSELKQKLSGNSQINQKSTFVIDGANIYIESLFLDGALLVYSVDNSEVKLSARVKNDGWIFEPVDYKDDSLPEEIRIRGFAIKKIDQTILKYDQSGKYCVDFSNIN